MPGTEPRGSAPRPERLAGPPEVLRDDESESLGEWLRGGECLRASSTRLKARAGETVQP